MAIGHQKVKKKKSFAYYMEFLISFLELLLYGARWTAGLLRLVIKVLQ